MSRYVGPRLRRARRVGMDLDLLGSRSYESKCKAERRPGQHFARRGRPSDYEEQLAMKQAMRYFYGLSESQFYRYYMLADKRRGSTAQNLHVLLESRLDNVVYRLGFSSTRAESRQLVGHKGICVNDQLVNIPSYLLRPGDRISLSKRAVDQVRVQSALTLAEQRNAEQSWIEITEENKKKVGVFKAYPEFSDLPESFKINLVIELYSK